MIELVGIRLHAYGLLIGLGIYTAWELSRKYGEIEEKVLDRLIFGLIVSGVLGARVYHVVDLWEYYSKNIWEVLFLWNGGLGIWGALVGGATYLAIFTYFSKLNFSKTLDSIIIGVPFAQAIGRLGNWVNGELYGKNGEPLFAYEASLNILLGILLIYLYRLPRTTKTVHRNDGFIGGVYLVGYGLIRIALENFRSEAIIWKIGGVPTAIIFGSVSIFFGLALILWNKFGAKKTN